MLEKENPHTNVQETKDCNRPLGTLVWLCFLFFSSMALIVHQMGFRGHFGVEMIEYWYTVVSIVVLPIYVFFIFAPAFFFFLAYYLVMLSRKDHQSRISRLAGTGAISSFLTGVVWAIFYFILHTAENDYGLTQGVFVWGCAIVLFGETFVLIGVTYILRQDVSSFFSNLTGLSFILAGLVILTVGVIDGFALFPFISSRNYAWVTALTVVPCVLGVLYTYEVDPFSGGDSLE